MINNFDIVKDVCNGFELDVWTNKENETVWLRVEEMADLLYL